MELPTSHRIPLTWLIEHGGETIRYRALRELAPPGAATPEDLSAGLQALLTGAWGWLQVSQAALSERIAALWQGVQSGFESAWGAAQAQFTKS